MWGAASAPEGLEASGEGDLVGRRGGNLGWGSGKVCHGILQGILQAGLGGGRGVRLTGDQGDGGSSVSLF